MFKFKCENGRYIVTHNNTNYTFAHSRDAWAFIFAMKEAFSNE